MSSESPIPDFLRAFQAHRHEALEPFLHEEVAFNVEGLDPVKGRREVLAYWRRMFSSHQAIRKSPERHVRDGDLVIVLERHLYVRSERDPLVLDSMVIYELADNLIRSWTDGLQIADVGAHDLALWRRLRADRW